jgi:hypothetical protein
MSTKLVKCPHCHDEFDVQGILTQQLESDIKLKYEQQSKADRKKVDADAEVLAKAKEEFELAKKRENELFQDRLNKQLAADRKNLEAELKIKLLDENSEVLKSMQEELNEKSLQLKELNRAKADIEKLKREKDEMRETLEAESQTRLNEIISLEKEKIKRVEEERNEMKMRELVKQLEDQKKLTSEMRRKQEQGSMQMQGEILELAIEEWLTSEFPLDTIEEIKKGARGGDCIQMVNTRDAANCGRIYYESKRTKEFQSNWIEKFKNDMREKGVDIGVIVTEAMPAGMERMGQINGIWICKFEDFKSLAAILRESLIRVSLALVSQENKGDKMTMLYDFLTSSEFRMRIEAIVEGFTQMKAGLETEKRAMLKIWKEREKQIEKVVVNTIEMYGSVKGIAGNAIQSVAALELPTDNEIDEIEF